MTQNIYTILLFSLCAIILFYVCPKRYRAVALVAESLVFYAVCDWKFAFLIISETVVSWVLGRKKNKKSILIGILFVLLILAIFKYFNFFIDCFNLSFSHILLPLGISYYSFKIISYLADVYYHKRESEPSLISYSVYILFFPHLICGPIVRSISITERIKAGVIFDTQRFYSGIVKIIYGLFMKTVIADRGGGYVSLVFTTPDDYPSLALIFALCLYAIQLYCDFAGYSLIAQGLTNCFGFDCISNFKRPYFASDIRDFWRRWHISLSSWLRDYIYIPLGGNRCSVLKKWINVLITFIACGMWHGSNLPFIIWGTYHGILNNLTPKKKNVGEVNGVIKRFLTLILVLFGWLLFRSESIPFALHFITRVFTHFSLSYANITASVLPFTGDNTAIAYAITLFFMIALLFIKELLDEKREISKGIVNSDDNSNSNVTQNYTLFWTSLFLILTVLFGIIGSSNFLYANF